jgi:hypothetical protein
LIRKPQDAGLGSSDAAQIEDEKRIEVQGTVPSGLVLMDLPDLETLAEA